jgi:ribosomal protein S7
MIKKKKVENKTNIKLKNQLLNHLIVNGNKETSEKLILKSLKLNQKHGYKNHKELFKSAIIHSSPLVNIKQIRRKKKQIKEFPFVLKKHARISLAVKSILNVISQKSEAFFSKKLNNEIIFASKKNSNSVRNKKDLHENAFIKKKFANYRWF